MKMFGTGMAIVENTMKIVGTVSFQIRNRVKIISAVSLQIRNSIVPVSTVSFPTENSMKIVETISFQIRKRLSKHFPLRGLSGTVITTNFTFLIFVERFVFFLSNGQVVREDR